MSKHLNWVRPISAIALLVLASLACVLILPAKSNTLLQGVIPVSLLAFTFLAFWTIEFTLARIKKLESLLREVISDKYIGEDLSERIKNEID